MTVITVQSYDEIALHYSNQDIGKMRSARDMTAAMNLPAELGLPSKWIDRLVAAVRFMSICARDELAQKSRASTAAQVRLWSPFARKYYDLANNMPDTLGGTHLRRSIMSVALLSFRYTAQQFPEKVDAFWRGALCDDGLFSGDPRKRLYQHMSTVGLTGGGNVRPKAVSADYDARFAAACLNAFIAGRNRPRLIVDMKTALLVINAPEAEHWMKD